MNKHLRKVLYVGLATLMIGGLGASVTASQNVNASINPDNYGIDVFPSKRTHNRFAYQLRSYGHNSRIYYASKNSRLGRKLFDHSVPNNDYANYMARHHHKLFESVTKQLERHANNKRHVKSQKRVRKARSQRHHVIRRAKRVKRYNRKVRKSRRSKAIRNRRVAKKQTVLKSRFKRSNNKRALKRSGFFDAHALGGNFIFNKYAPSDKRAVVPKNMNVSNWYKGKFGQLNPTAYYYVPAVHGWLRLK